MKALILTVGGSHQPLLKAIQQTKPDVVHFLCSDDGVQPGSYHQIIGEGKVLRSGVPMSPPPPPDLPNLVTLANLQEGQYVVHKIIAADSLESCFRVAVEAIDAVHKRDPAARCFVDYTGGTKSMTAGLAAAALENDLCEFQIVTGRRDDLRQVKDGTEFVRSIAIANLRIQRAFKDANALVARFDYAGAVRLLEIASQANYSEEMQPRLRRFIEIGRAFDAWDRFEHEAAADLLRPYKREFPDHFGHLGLFLDGKGHGWELAEDLLLNAERRAEQDRYDDAVGRLYRALELGIQVWLQRKYGIDTGRVDTQKVPESFRNLLPKPNEGGRIEFGLRRAWELTEAWPDDELFPLFKPRAKSLLNHLSTRNNSLFAHGTTPITRETFRSFFEFSKELLSVCLEAAGKAWKQPSFGSRLKQFPIQFKT